MHMQFKRIVCIACIFKKLLMVKLITGCVKCQNRLLSIIFLPTCWFTHNIDFIYEIYDCIYDISRLAIILFSWLLIGWLITNKSIYRK